MDLEAFSWEENRVGRHAVSILVENSIWDDYLRIEKINEDFLKLAADEAINKNEDYGAECSVDRIVLFLKEYARKLREDTGLRRIDKLADRIR